MTDSELLSRLEKLERDNRRLKRLGLAALALVAGLGLVAAARPIPNVIKAHEFEVVDAAGRVRIRMAVNPWSLRTAYAAGSDVSLFDAAGRRLAALSADNEGSGLYLVNSLGVPVAAIDHSEQWTGNLEHGKLTNFKSAGFKSEISLGAVEGIRMNVNGAGEPRINMYGPEGPNHYITSGIDMHISGTNEPSINMYDRQGFRMALGSTSMQTIGTGATQQTSADSIVMFGNDKNGRVIWQAP